MKKKPINNKLDEAVILSELATMAENKESFKKMRRLLNPISYTDIALKYGVTKQAISYIATKNGIKVHN